MSSNFDQIAELYDASIAPLPTKYIRLIQILFHLNKDDRIIDLGCGSGLLTFPLAQFSSHVEGLDSSNEMIKTASMRDIQKRIRWIHSPIEEFDFGYDLYKLIISFESFHLFPNADELVRRCALALKRDGYFCIGWCSYQWEIPLKEIIIDTFASYDIIWGQWGYQACPNITEVVHEDNRLSSMVIETLKIQTISYINNIASYLANIGKTVSLSIEIRNDLAQDLETKFKNYLQSDQISGVSSYYVAYCRKCT